MVCVCVSGRGERVNGELSAQLRANALTLLTVRGAERAPQKRTSADSAQGARRACHGARANPAPRGARRRRDGCDWRREASRPSQARRSGGWIAPRGRRRIRGNAPKRSGGKIRRSRTRRVRKHPRGVEARTSITHGTVRMQKRTTHAARAQSRNSLTHYTVLLVRLDPGRAVLVQFAPVSIIGFQTWK